MPTSKTVTREPLIGPSGWSGKYYLEMETLCSGADAAIAIWIKLTVYTKKSRRICAVKTKVQIRLVHWSIATTNYWCNNKNLKRARFINFSILYSYGAVAFYYSTWVFSKCQKSAEENEADFFAKCWSNQWNSSNPDTPLNLRIKTKFQVFATFLSQRAFIFNVPAKWFTLKKQHDFYWISISHTIDDNF